MSGTRRGPAHRNEGVRRPNEPGGGMTPAVRPGQPAPARYGRRGSAVDAASGDQDENGPIGWAVEIGRKGT